MSNTAQAHRPLAEILLEIKSELISFAETRIRLFQSELLESRRSLKRWLPLAVATYALLGTAYLLLTSALVSLVSIAFVGSPYRWPLTFLVAGVFWMVAGLIAARLTLRAFRSRASFPGKTVEILKADGLWLNDEVKRTA